MELTLGCEQTYLHRSRAAAGRWQHVDYCEAAHPQFAPIVSKEFLWTNSLSYCPRPGEHPASDDFSVYFPSQDGERNEKHEVFVSPVALLRMCAKNKDLNLGTRIHFDILKRGLLGKCSDALITMYAKCGALLKAQELLNIHRSKDVVTWTALISAYVRNGHDLDALACYEEMKNEGLSPDGVAYACILKACGNLRAIQKGEQIHYTIASQGLLGHDNTVNAAVIDMYAKCGALAKAQSVLEELPSRDALSWGGLIAGYTQYGHGDQALVCFEQMKSEGCYPNASTFASILKACGIIGSLDNGKKVHDAIAKEGLLENDAVLCSALIDMYAKCGALERAKEALKELPSQDVYAWSALIAGYVQQGRGEEALQCFKQMQREGISPDAVTFSSVLQACGIIGAIDEGEQIHDVISKKGLLDHNAVLGTALVNMYAKCGALSKAMCVLEQLPSQDVFSWNSLISGYANKGHNEQALACFEYMQRKGCNPDAATFSCVLSACSHLGLLNEARMHFLIMRSKYGIQPDIEQYTCMVDLFGRAGRFDKAVEMILEMPSTNVSAVWRALLGACRKWRNVTIGRWAFEQAIKIDVNDVAAHVLMGNIYSAAGMQKEAELIAAMKSERDICMALQV